MGYCKICKQTLADPLDCDCRCKHGWEIGLVMPCAECEREEEEECLT